MNKVMLIGRISRDIELKSTEKAVLAKFGLAVKRRKIKKEQEEQTDFINILAWNKTAEYLSKYAGKGTQISVVGNIQMNAWEDSQGQKRYSFDVVAEEVSILGESKKQENNNEAQQNQEINMQTKIADTAYVEADTIQDLLDDDNLPF